MTTHAIAGNPGFRELDAIEIDHVYGGSAVGASWKVGTMIGTFIYNSLSPETQDAIGGTITTAIDNIRAGHPFS